MLTLFTQDPNPYIRPEADGWVPVGEALIFRLPDELLVAILEFTTSHCRTRSGRCHCERVEKYGYMKLLALVCHHFNEDRSQRGAHGGNASQKLGICKSIFNLSLDLDRHSANSDS